MSEAARLGRNFSANASAQLITQVLTLIVSIVLARTLGIEQYGIFAFGFAFPSWFLLLTALGLDSVLTIEVAANRKKASAYVTTIALMRLPLALLSVLFLWIAVQLLLVDPFARTVTLLLGIGGVLQTYAGTFTSVFRAFERLEYDAIVVVTERHVTVGSVLLLLFLGYGLFEIALVFIAGGILSVALSLILLRRRFVWFSGTVDRREAGRILRLTAPFALMKGVTVVAATAGLVLLTLLLDPAATGQYNAAHTLVFALLAIFWVYDFVLLPTLSRMNRESREKVAAVLQQTQKLAFLVGLPAALGGWLYAEEIVTLFYGDAFRASAASFQVLIFILLSSTAVLGNGTALAATGRQRLNLYISSAGAATIIGLNVALIPVLGPVGAATAALSGALLRASLHWATVRRLVARVDPWATYGRTALAGGTMLLLLLALPPLPLFVGVGLGALLYFVILLIVRGITREDWSVMKSALRGAFYLSR